jgi:hypothetical protein
MKRQAIKTVLISNHRDTEVTEAFFPFCPPGDGGGQKTNPLRGKETGSSRQAGFFVCRYLPANEKTPSPCSLRLCGEK